MGGPVQRATEKVLKFDRTVHHSFLRMRHAKLQISQRAHADPCPLLEDATMGTQASNLDHGAWEEGGLV